MVTTRHRNVAIVTASGRVNASELSHEDWGEILTCAKDALTVRSLSSLSSIPELLKGAGYVELLNTYSYGLIDESMEWVMKGYERPDFLFLGRMCREEDVSKAERRDVYLAFRRGKEDSNFFALTVLWRVDDTEDKRHYTLTATSAIAEEIPDLGEFLSGFGEHAKKAALNALHCMRQAQEKTQQNLSSKLHAASEARAKLFGFCRRIQRD